MTLVGKSGFLRNQGKRLTGPLHQGFRPLDPPLHDVALRTEADRLLEGAAEMIRLRQATPARSAVVQGSGSGPYRATLVPILKIVKPKGISESEVRMTNISLRSALRRVR
ncbi:MAG TPA: hypothetical protein VJX94_31255 [Stellaceae bacterium]|nr:hypothetical protein [Stellaceae bacterium]